MKKKTFLANIGFMGFFPYLCIKTNVIIMLICINESGIRRKQGNPIFALK